MSANLAYLYGSVLDADLGRALSGKQVSVGVMDGTAFRAFVSVTTDTKGEFRASLVAAPSANGPFVFRVYDGKRLLPIVAGGTWRRELGEAPQAVVRVKVGNYKSDVDSIAAPETLTTGKSVQGVVYRPNGEPYVYDPAHPADVPGGGDLRARAYSIGIGVDPEQVGSTATVGANGRYGIALPSTPAIKRLVVRITTASGGLDVGSSDLLVVPAALQPAIAPAHHRADVVLTNAKLRGPAEYTVIDRARTAADGPLHGVTDLSAILADDLIALQTELNFDLGVLAMYIAARDLGGRLESALSESHVQGLYGLLRRGFPSSAAQLVLRGSDEIVSALLEAADAHVIEQAIATEGASFATWLRGEARRHLGAASTTPGSVANFIKGTLASDVTKQKRFLELMDAHAGDAAGFWTAVAGDVSLGSSAASLKSAVEVGLVALNHGAFVDALGGNVASLVEMNDAGLAAVIDESHAPPGVFGDEASGETVAEAYLKLIREQLARVFPSPVFHKNLRNETDPAYVSSATKTYLTSHTAFDFEVTVDPAIASGVKSELQKLQRMYRISPPTRRYGKVQKKLLETGHTDATKISRFTWAAFQRKHTVTSGGGAFSDDDKATLKSVYLRARQQASFAYALTAFHHPGLQQPRTITSPGLPVPASSAGDANYKSVFGALSSCACGECQSVMSPSAYLVDVFEWLDAQDGEEGATLWDTLVDRRPDVPAIELSCSNTNTVLPYVDLVNEVLEDELATQHGIALVPHVATHGTSEERLVTPEYRNDAVYTTVVATVVRTVNLPFDLSLAESRGFLPLLGHARIDVMRAFAWPGDGSPTANALAAEELGLNAAAYHLVAAGNAVAAYARWGYTGADTDWVNRLRGASLPAGVGANLLVRASLSLDELRDVLHSRYVNPRFLGLRTLTLAFTDECDIDTYRVNSGAILGSVVAADFTRMSRFLRVWRATGWSMLTLDKAIVGLALGFVGDADELSVNKLADVQRLHRRTGRPVEELLSWWADLDTFADRAGLTNPVPSWYDRVFLSPVVAPILSESPFRLNADRTDLAIALSGSTLADYEKEVSAALHITSADWTALAAVVSLGSPINLANLSLLYRNVSLARVLRLSVFDFLRLHAFIEVNAFTSPHAAGLFLDAVDEWRQSGTSLDDLEYLLLEDPAARAAVGLSADDLITLTGRLRDRLVVPDLNLASEGTSADALRLDTLWTALAELLAVDRATAAALDAVNFAYFSGGATKASDVLLAAPFLYAPAVAGDPWADLRAPASDSAAEHAVNTVELLAKAVRIVRQFDVTAAELTAWHAAALATATSFDVGGETTSELFPLRLLPAEKTTPLPPANQKSRFSQLMATSSLFQARAALPGELGWENIIDRLYGLHATPLSLADVLAARTGWKTTDLAPLLATVGATTPGVGTTARGVPRVGQAMAITLAAGVSATMVASWVAMFPSLTMSESEAGALLATAAAEIVAAARARQADMAAWVAVARPIRDGLRDAQRDALVACLLDGDALRTPNDLYEKLLIDVEMSHCALTSRIRLAMSSAQLFVQRVAMGLEGSLTLASDATDQWQAMKQYRVWEAGRKVYLWPENWMEPSLRDDKTPLFEALEATLQQGDLTDANVEAAVVVYLEDLHQLGTLEAAGVYHENVQDDYGTTDTLHVFARTRSTPRRYYYRRRVDGWRWTAWENVAIEIPGDHLVPVMHDRCLYLLWPVFTPRTTVVENESVVSMDVQLGWARLASGVWHGPNVGAATLAVADTNSPLSFRCNSGTDADGNLTLEITVNYSEVDQPPHLRGSFVLNGATFDVTVDEEGGTRPTDVTAGVVFEGQRLRVVTPSVGVEVALSAEPYPEASEYTARRVLNKPGDIHHLLFNAQDRAFNGLDIFFLTGTARTWMVEPKSIPGSDQRRAGMLATPWALGTFAPMVARYKQPQAHVLASRLTLNPIAGIPAGVRSRDAFVLRAENRRRLGSAQEHDTYAVAEDSAEYWFTPLYHPYTSVFLREVRRHGVMGLLDPQPGGSGQELIRQQLSNPTMFADTYAPTSSVPEPYPVDRIDFDENGTFAQYNWEVFFHTPMAVADLLTQNQRFEQASRWLHTIFDPRNLNADSGSGRLVWKFAPLAVDPSDPIEAWSALYETASGEPLSAAATALLEKLERQTSEWRKDPFNPYLVARMRFASFQRFVVMRYLDNLLAWGDALFAQDTIESLNEATQLYVLAAKILGDKPSVLTKGTDPTVKSFATLGDGDTTYVAVEQRLTSSNREANAAEQQPLPVLSHLDYFGIPPNAKLLAYWDTLADRMFKLRNCMNLAGDVRQLALFEPPIDPGLLVRARAAGVDLATALWKDGQHLPNFRFSYVSQRAQNLAASVRGLGSAMLQAIEKRDGEALSLLRSNEEIQLLELVREQKVVQVTQARESRAATQRTLDLATGRKAYYDRLLSVGQLPKEEAQLKKMKASNDLQSASELSMMAGAAFAWVPDVEAGMSGSFPFFSAEPPIGSKLAGIFELTGRALAGTASRFMADASKLGIQAGYARREQEWKQQVAQSTLEIQQAERQLAAADIGVALAERDLQTHDQQTENAREVDAFMRTKFSNDQLYTWMVGQLSALYFKSYQLAFDVAKQAESCFAYEVALNPADVSYIRYGAWDSLKKGLLAGERLQADLERMEAAYMDLDVRELELTKQISLQELDPMALLHLRELGTSDFEVPEAWFDIDYPGHWFRRIQSVSVSLPSVSGPIAGLAAELRLSDAPGANYIRVATGTDDDYRDRGSDNVREQVSGTTNVIATSTGAEDAGVFSLDWRDPKYLPFERRGAISRWSLALSGAEPSAPRTFDWQSIADVVLTVRYTARPAPDALRTKAIAELRPALNGPEGEGEESLTGFVSRNDNDSLGLKRAFRVATDFANAWYAFLHPVVTDTDQTLVLPISADDFPYAFRTDARIRKIELLIRAGVGSEPAWSLPLQVTLGSEMPPEVDVTIDVAKATEKFGLPSGLWTEVDPEPALAPATLTLVALAADIAALPSDYRTGSRLNVEKFQDLIVVLHYAVG